jgi:acyl-homoserine-lactone acylase
MKSILLLFISLIPVALLAQSKAEISRWEAQAKQVKIIRDNWGIPHIYGKTDADAVFGLLYAQCEDDFMRVEMNYIEKLGRTAEVKGEAEIYKDLLMKMVIDSTEAMTDYQKSPIWLKKLLNAYADGINFFLYKNPQIKPALLKKFQAWYPLLWTDGSIGAINTADFTPNDLEAFYSKSPSLGSIFQEKPTQAPIEKEEILTGSNGFAFAPSITESGKAILYINPHVTFYFRPEVHVVSEEGLNVYGAVTWGQFFVYQGFNEKCGWIHTSNYTDVTDMYIEKVSKKGEKWFYEYEKKLKPIREKTITLRYLKDGKIAVKNINALYTHHGAVMKKEMGNWLSLKSNNRSLNGLIQCWQRTKARSFIEYKKSMELVANTSNNTVYADAEGNIAYWHGNFLPIRDTRYDWSKPVDGSIAATEWKGLHKVEESVHLYNPANGWLQNCNATPFTVAGKYSPKKENFPYYMAPDGENFRGVNAVKVLDREKKYNLDKVIAAGYDDYLAAFEVLIPPLVSAFEQNIKPQDSLYAYLVGAVMVLKNWDYRSTEKSIATTLAIEWGQKLLPAIQKVQAVEDEELDQVEKTTYFVKNTTPKELLMPLLETLQELNKKFGRWQVAWGEINRFQRISNSHTPMYDDKQPSLPVKFASSAWGMLPSYTSRYFNTNKRYGVNGNSFICAVEFGDKIKAKSLLAGGESGNPQSKHFKDQAEMYTQGKFKEVLFYKEDIEKKAERTYHPGE